VLSGVLFNRYPHAIYSVSVARGNITYFAKFDEQIDITSEVCQKYLCDRLN